MKLSSFERYPGQVVFSRLIEKAFQTTWEVLDKLQRARLAIPVAWQQQGTAQLKGQLGEESCVVSFTD